MYGHLVCGVGLIIVYIPIDLPIRLNTDTALVLVDVPENYRKTESGYISSDYPSNADFAELYLNLGIGGVVIRDSNEK